MRLFIPLTALAFLIAGVSCSRQAEETVESPADDQAAQTGSASSQQAKPQDSADTSASGSAESDPQALVKQVAQHLQAARTVQVENEITVQMQSEAMNNQMTMKRSIVTERPNRIAVRSQKGNMGADVVSDGKKMVTYLAATKRYTEEDAPQTFEELLQNPMLGAATPGTGFSVLHLLTEDAYKRLMEGVSSVEYAGREKIDGTETDHLKFTQQQIDWEMWISTGENPLVQKVAMDLTELIRNRAGNNAPFGKDIKMTAVMRLRNWKLGEDPPAEAFVFEPPEGAQKADSLLSGLGGKQPQKSPLLGKPAPPLELELLQDGKLSLQDHLDQDVVLLDFWATWCGPCVKAMPVVAEVAREYADRGVVLYAVNLEESKARIRKFLDREGIDVTVALDPNGEAGSAYNATRIPRLVLIGKDGTVQSVHRGYRPDMKSQLTEEIDTLLAGENLAETNAPTTAPQDVKEQEAAADSKSKAESKPEAATGLESNK